MRSVTSSSEEKKLKKNVAVKLEKNMFRESCTYEIFRFLLHQYFLSIFTKLDHTSVVGDSTEFKNLTIFLTKFVPREMKTLVNI